MSDRWAVYVLRFWGWERRSRVFESMTEAVDHLAQLGPENGTVRRVDV